MFKTYTSRLNDLKHHARPISLELHKPEEGRLHILTQSSLKALRTRIQAICLLEAVAESSDRLAGCR